MREQHLESGFGTGELARNFEKVTASERSATSACPYREWKARSRRTPRMLGSWIPFQGVLPGFL